MIHDLIQSAILVLAVSADALISSFAYGIRKIKIPFKSVMVISAICSGILGASLFAGGFIRAFLSEGTASLLCFFILFLLGGVKLLDNALKALIRRHNPHNLKKELKFKLLSLNFILNVYANPEEADEDRSKTLSPAEAASLAVALSLDGLAAGAGTAIGGANKPLIIALSFIIGVFAVTLGCALGNKAAAISGRSKTSFGWIGGAGLMALAVYKLL